MPKYNGFDHEQVWGSIGDYCNAVGRAPEELIEEKWKEIEYLQKRYDELLDRRKDMEWQMLCRTINEVIHSKRKRLAEIELWQKKR